MSTPETSVHPVFLKLSGRTVLVVGAGQVAQRKIASLLEAGATVVVVAPDATGDVERLARDGAIRWEQRTFQDGDADGAWLVVAATKDADVQRGVAEAAERRH